MSDYRDFFIDGPRGPRRDPDAPNEFFTPGRTLANGRASLTVTMTKAQKRMYLELGGAPWLKNLLTDALKAKTPNVKVTGSPALSASPRGLPGYTAGDNTE